MSYFKITSEIQGMVLTLSINFLPFSSVKNLFRCSEIFGSKFYKNLFGYLPFERLNIKRLSEKGIMYFENFSLNIWFFLIIERPTRYPRHTCYTHKHPRTPYGPTSALRDLLILDSFIILVDYFAVLSKYN